MTRQAGEWSAHAPEERFRGGQRFTELRDLADTLDGVLDRLSAVLRHERQLSAELSHELRTPLAHIVAETELLLAREPDHLAIQAIRDSALSMDAIIETLLTTARTRLQTTASTCDVQDAVDRLVAGLPVRVTGTVLVGVEQAVVERMLAPILENARRYARNEVRVEIRRSGNEVLIDVSNDGQPIDGDLLESIFEPGVRGDPGDGHDGAGLGLALARRLARSAEGDVVALPSATGAIFRVTLPPG
jgi:signal transduction histidine kinase